MVKAYHDLKNASKGKWQGFLKVVELKVPGTYIPDQARNKERLLAGYSTSRTRKCLAPVFQPDFKKAVRKVWAF
jgi:hypothetical protein